MLTAALVSLSVVFVAELGDKSQLMTMTYALPTGGGWSFPGWASHRSWCTGSP
jgi:putative Ca2+/H+ antiporter (TMEM165/GDT1 family)